MGVMPCNRAMCRTILCTRYSQEYGFICDECLTELKEADPTNIAEWMRTPRKDTRSIDEIFQRIDS